MLPFDLTFFSLFPWPVVNMFRNSFFRAHKDCSCQSSWRLLSFTANNLALTRWLDSTICFRRINVIMWFWSLAEHLGFIICCRSKKKWIAGDNPTSNAMLWNAVSSEVVEFLAPLVYRHGNCSCMNNSMSICYYSNLIFPKLSWGNEINGWIVNTRICSLCRGTCSILVVWAIPELCQFMFHDNCCDKTKWLEIVPVAFTITAADATEKRNDSGKIHQF